MRKVARNLPDSIFHKGGDDSVRIEFFDLEIIELRLQFVGWYRGLADTLSLIHI